VFGIWLSLVVVVIFSVLIWAAKWGHPRKLAVCCPPQLQHVGGRSRVLGQFEAKWFSAHLTHLIGCPQLREPCSKRWHEKHWAGADDL